MIPVESVNIFKAAIALLKDPANIAKTTGEVMVQSIGSTTKDEFQFGEAFAANFLGHYLLLKELEGVLEKTTKLLKDENRGWEGARVIWLTSDTAEHHMFDPNDIMCLKGAYPYESSKRLIELIHLETAARLREKGIYSVVANPGISATDVMKGTVPTWLILVALYFFRFCFLPAVCITPFNASRSEAYLAIEVTDPNELNPKTVYQSDVTFWGTSRVRKLVLRREGVMDCSADVCTNGNVDLTKIREEVDAIYNRVKKVSA
ncbi:hypothetical protein BCR33DRAFT_348927 [Rhizoclosmatium globosum]|uniref:NAD(P)-binding protein n=1 Tax=Rhizoclosmatium globosum TaxID=329046 RepID=A0A1Y2C238_9FUNG|nr:hypothetical protein BCR33DRAFT_348927 [Rhizoclosmatium globosum]|eukprot:ORY40947.1 hypothetical protein BCR33DRAFT_348927 [Rhizoclosmatium globosum]